MYFIFWCSFANADKNGTNNWNQTFSKYLRLLEHTSVKISMSFTSWVLELVGFDFSKRIIFLCSFAAFDQAKFQCVALLNFWLIRLNSLLYVNVIFKKRPCLSSRGGGGNRHTHPQKICSSPENPKCVKLSWWRSENFLAHFLANFCTPESSRVHNAGKAGKYPMKKGPQKFWPRIHAHKTRHWSGALLTTNFFDRLQRALLLTRQFKGS